MKRIPRRDRIYRLRIQMSRNRNPTLAWRFLAIELDKLADRDLPKFEDLFQAIEKAHNDSKK